MGKNVTIIDIAKETGLSVATVSRVLNQHHFVKEDTREKVMNAADKLGYQVNYLAKSLSSASGNMIGMLIPDIRNPFYGRIFSICEKTALEKGYILSLCNSFSNPKLETHFYTHLQAQHACGVIQIGGSLDRQTIPPQLFSQIKSTAEKIPVITSAPVENTDCRCIYVDNSRCMRTLLEHLIGLGHRRIAFVGGRNSVCSTLEKRHTYSAVLKEHGIHDEIIFEGNYGKEDGYFAVKNLFRQKHPPTAIIAVTDTCAIGVIQALNEIGLQCGRDVSVASFDNTYIAEMLEPELTSVSTNYEILGETIIYTMIDMIEKKETKDIYDIPLMFSIRSSCAKI
nr:LacI family DNA-binding transcriptional regulator [uncultured Marvinbryantia sp.]